MESFIRLPFVRFRSLPFSKEARSRISMEPSTTSLEECRKKDGRLLAMFLLRGSLDPSLYREKRKSGRSMLDFSTQASLVDPCKYDVRAGLGPVLDGCLGVILQRRYTAEPTDAYWFERQPVNPPTPSVGSGRVPVAKYDSDHNFDDDHHHILNVVASHHACAHVCLQFRIRYMKDQ